MSVKIKDNTAKIKSDTLRGVSLAIRFMLDDIDKIANPVTPKRQGDLRRNIIKQVLGNQGTITWGKNYAFYQETKQYANYTTAGTGPHYAQKSVKKVADEAEQYFKKAKVIL